MVQSLIFKKDEIKVIDVSKEAKAVGYMLVILIYAVLFKKKAFWFLPYFWVWQHWHLPVPEKNRFI